MTTGRRRRSHALGVVLSVLTVATACSSGARRPAMPAVPEPAAAPPVRVAPAGVVVPLPGHPEGLVFDPASGVLAAGIDGGITMLGPDGSARSVVPLGGRPRHLSLSGPDVVAPLEGIDTVAFVAPATGEVAGRVAVGRQPHDAVAAGGRLFVGDELGDEISVLEHDTVIATLPSPTQPGGVASDGRAVAVVGVRARRIAFVDAAAAKTVAVLPSGVGPTHVVGSDGTFFVADTQGDAILAYRANHRPHATGRTPLRGTPYGMALDATRHRLWVTSTATNEVTELSADRTRLTVLRRFPTVRQPNSVAVDATSGTVYVVGTADSQLQVLHP